MPGQLMPMLEVIKHRGPDGEGTFYNDNFALGHRRLSIIDLSDAATQPMHQFGYTIVFNGEIYNYIEIREELLKSGYVFSTHSDTEVILAAYDCWGFDCQNRFNGMWSFALYDPKKQMLFCSRDRFGVKPFYFVDNGKCFAFGSEIKQLLPFLSERKPNYTILADYLIGAFEDHTNDTFFEGVKKLDASHYLVYDLGRNQYKIERYYHIHAQSSFEQMDEYEAIEEFGALLKDAVHLRLRSDVKVGTCLSGGLDSSSIAAIASALYQENSAEKFTAITAKSTDAKRDETSYAKMVVDRHNLAWYQVEPRVMDFNSEINAVIKLQEEPFGSPSIYMQYKVFEEARRTGTVVMLDGQGGDETLLGYERYFPARILSAPFFAKFIEFLSAPFRMGISHLQLTKYMFYFTNYFVRKKYLFSRANFVKPLLKDAFSREIIRENTKAYYNIRALQELEITHAQLPHLLKYEDRNSMAHSIESRLPFLDYRLLEASLSLPHQLKLNNGWSKYILRKVSESYLPTEISWRRNKFGFEAPESLWLSPMTTIIQQTIRQSALLDKITDKNAVLNRFTAMDLRMQWRLFNIAAWEQSFEINV